VNATSSTNHSCRPDPRRGSEPGRGLLAGAPGAGSAARRPSAPGGRARPIVGAGVAPGRARSLQTRTT
jgi:hypothetical protein